MECSLCNSEKKNYALLFTRNKTEVGICYECWNEMFIPMFQCGLTQFHKVICEKTDESIKTGKDYQDKIGVWLEYHSSTSASDRAESE